MKKVFKIEDYSGNYVMHCKTREESDKFRRYLDSIGRTWSDGSKYTEWEHWDNYRENTCYNFNKGKYDQVDWYKSGVWTILEFSDFIWPEFTKSDLKDGMVVEYRNGYRRVVLNKCVMNPNKLGYLEFSDYHDDLIMKSGNRSYDIVKVYSSTGKNISSYCDDTSLTLIWEREKKSTHKYKPGDRVKVRSDISSFNIYGGIGFVASMDDFIGKVVTIKDTVFNSCGVPAYYISEDRREWYWSDEMFEGLVDYEEMTVAEIEKKLGYKIKVVGNDA